MEIFTLESQLTESPATEEEEAKKVGGRLVQNEAEGETETLKLLCGESGLLGEKQQSGRKGGKRKRRRKGRQMESAQLAPSQEGYLPVKVKKTIVRPKKKKKRR